MVLAEQMRHAVEDETLDIVHRQMPAVQSVIARPDVEHRLAWLWKRDPEEPSVQRVGRLGTRKAIQR